MAKFEITAPDGSVYEIDGENEQGALQALQQHLGSKPNGPNLDGTYGKPPEGMVLNPETGQMEDLRSPINPNIPQGTANSLGLGVGPFGGDYDYNLARMREAERRASEEHPAAYYGGQVGGALGTGVGLAKGGLSATNAAIKSGWRLPAVSVASGIEGTAMGAGYGFGAGEGKEGRLTGARDAGLLGLGVGFVAPGLVSGASKAYQKARTPFASSPERAAAVRTLESEGVPLTAGQKTGSKWLQYRESELGGGRAADMMDEQARAFTDAAMRKAGSSGLARPENLGELEEQLAKGFKEMSARNTLTLDRGLINDILKTTNRYGTKLDALKKPIFDNVRIDIVNEFTKNKGKVSGAWYQQTRSDLSKLAQSARGNDDMLADAYRGLRDALDDTMERSIEKTNPSDLGAWKQLRKHWGNFRVVADASRGAGEAGGQGFITPAKLAQAAGKGKNGLAFSTGKSDFTDLVKAGQTAMTPLPNSGTAQRIAAQGVFAALLGSGGGAVAGPYGLALGLAGPALAGRALMSKPVQNYLANQIAKGPLKPETRGLLQVLLNAEGGLAAGRLGSP